MQINKKIKEARELKQWTQEEIADAIGEKRTTYSGWEKKTIPSFDIVLKISKVTGMPLKEFIAAVDENMAQVLCIEDEISSSYIINDPHVPYSLKKEDPLIEVKTASGKILKIKPEGSSEKIAILNAFLEERDRVIDTIKNEKQAHIDELIKDKEELYKLLNSNLGDISKVQQAIFAMVRTLQEYEAATASLGNKKREAEMLNSLSKLNGDNLKVDAKQDNALVLRK